MFEKILIANRGEMAVRILRACRELGVRTVAIYSQADAGALHVTLADERVCVGPAAPGASYLNVPNIISAALNTGSDAIHPGAGFLAENAYFAEVCGRYHITFIGPTPENIRAMGDKTQARRLAREAGLPVVSGSDRPVADVNEAKEIAKQYGYPVMLKAVAGGGGRGIRPVADPGELVALFPLAQAEARSSFGNQDLYLEKLIPAPRHVEVQILSDGQQSVQLGLRGCSIQRRFQKLVEEAPAPNLALRLQQRVADAALRLTRAIKYQSAGTVEFLLDASDAFYFMEMNTRIQVEHPVTEMVTGLDLVKLQIQIAAGAKLPFRQKDVAFSGHAIEFRIIAEDPERDFRPDAGAVHQVHFPGGPGVRIDTHIASGYDVSPYYDSLLAKLIVWGATRAGAIARARGALAECTIDGPATNLPFHRSMVEDPAFASGAYDAGYVASALTRAAGAAS